MKHLVVYDIILSMINRFLFSTKSMHLSSSFFFFSFSRIDRPNFFSIITSINHMLKWEHRRCAISCFHADIFVQFSMITSTCKCHDVLTIDTRAKRSTRNVRRIPRKKRKEKETNDKIDFVLFLFSSISWKS